MAKYLSKENYENVSKSIDYLMDMSEKRSNQAEKIIEEYPREHTKQEFEQALHDRRCEDIYMNAIRTIKSIIVSYTDAEEDNSILTDEEKKYLGAVFKPYKDKIVGITKLENKDLESEYLYIDIRSWKRGYGQGWSLPDFQAGTQFINMELNKEYSLEELGL